MPDPAITEYRNDGVAANALAMLNNRMTGLGQGGRDKYLEHTIALDFTPLTRPDLQALYRKSKICEKVVDLLPKAATAENWLEVTVGKGRKGIPAKAVQYSEDLKLRTAVREAAIMGRLDGDGFAIVGVDDGGEPWEPVNEGRIRKLSWVYPVDRWRILPETMTGRPGNPEWYSLYLPFTDALPDQRTSGKIHRSRVMRFPGKKLWSDMITHNTGYNDSVLQTFFQSFVKYLIAIEYSTRMVQDYNVFTYKLQGLAQLILQGDQEKIFHRFQGILMSMSSLGGLAMDADKEDAQFITRNFSGLDALIDKLKDDTSAAAAMPPTQLWGSSQKSALSNSSEGDKYAWADCVADYRSEILAEPTSDFFRLVFLAQNGPTGGRLPESWGVKYRSALRLNLKEQTALRKDQTMGVDVPSVNAGILLKQEVRESAWGGDEYTIERQLQPDLYTQQQAEKEQKAQPSQPQPEADDGADNNGNGNGDRPGLALRTDDATPAKRIIDWHGFKLGLQYQPFDIRHGKVLPVAYGHIQKTRGADGMACDCYVGADLEIDRVFEVTQLVNGAFDEHKYMLGFDSLDAARETFLKVMPPEMFGGIREVGLSAIDQYRTDDQPRDEQGRFAGGGGVAKSIAGSAAAAAAGKIIGGAIAGFAAQHGVHPEVAHIVSEVGVKALTATAIFAQGGDRSPQEIAAKFILEASAGTVGKLTGTHFNDLLSGVGGDAHIRTIVDVVNQHLGTSLGAEHGLAAAKLGTVVGSGVGTSTTLSKSGLADRIAESLTAQGQHIKTLLGRGVADQLHHDAASGDLSEVESGALFDLALAGLLLANQQAVTKADALDRSHIDTFQEGEHPRDEHGRFAGGGGGEQEAGSAGGTGGGGGGGHSSEVSHAIAKVITTDLKENSYGRMSQKDAAYNGLDPKHPGLGWEEAIHDEHLSLYKESGDRGLGQELLDRLSPENEDSWGTISRLARVALQDVDWQAVSDHAQKHLDGKAADVKGNEPTKAVAKALADQIKAKLDPENYDEEEGDAKKQIESAKSKLQKHIEDTTNLKKQFNRETNPNTAGENFNESLWLHLADYGKAKVDPAIIGEQVAQTMKLPQSVEHEKKTGRAGQAVVEFEKTQAYKDQTDKNTITALVQKNESLKKTAETLNLSKERLEELFPSKNHWIWKDYGRADGGSDRTLPKSVTTGGTSRIDAVNPVVGIIDRADKHLQGLEDSAIERVNSALESSYQSLEAQILRSYSQETPGSLMARDRAAVLLSQVADLLGLINTRNAEDIQQAFEDLLRGADAQGATLADDLSRAIANQSLQATAQIPLSAVINQVEAGMQRLRNHTEAFADKASTIVSQGLIQGFSVQKVASLLKRELGVVQSKAETIARTESISALDAATRSSYQQNGVGYVQRIGTLDNRICPFCVARIGNVYPVDKAPASLHPNDRCYNAPFKFEWLELGLVDTAWLQKFKQGAIAELAKQGLEPDNGLAPFEKANGLDVPVAVWELGERSDEDQPRDEHGRFAAVGGAAKSISGSCS